MDRFGPYTTVVENLFLVMNLRRSLKEFLVQQISVADGRVYLLFHAESPVKVDKLIELIHKQKNRFRLMPDGRLSFAPKNLDWEPLIEEVTELLRSIQDLPSQAGFPAEIVIAPPA
jgi:transcription-repair coupling factor (superfamily II helicase)